MYGKDSAIIPSSLGACAVHVATLHTAFCVSLLVFPLTDEVLPGNFFVSTYVYVSRFFLFLRQRKEGFYCSLTMISLRILWAGRVQKEGWV